MAGGSLNLSSTNGTGEDIINIQPQITFFKKIYKRHTNFGLETIENTVSNNSINFGDELIYTIDKIGSLIHNMHVEFTLPPAINTDGKSSTGKEFTAHDDNVGVVNNWADYCGWVNSVGFAILDDVSLLFNDNLIDKHNSVWFDIWNELTDVNRAEWSLVGKRDDTENNIINNKKSRYYVPLKFYFNRHPGLSFPVFLLDEGGVKVKIKLNSRKNLLIFNISDNAQTPPTFNDIGGNLLDFKFFTNYIFLDTLEQNKISNNLPIEYLIETIDIKENLKEKDLNIILDNPVKEIIWVIRNIKRITEKSNTDILSEGTKYNEVNLDVDNENTNDIFNYSLSKENLNMGYGTYDTFKTLKLSISNKDRINTTDATYFRTMQPYNHHSNIPGGINKNNKSKYIYSYSFAINPEEYQPSGSYNFSKSNDSLNITFNGLGQSEIINTNNFDDYRLDLFSINYKYLSVNKGSISYQNVPYNSISNSLKQNPTDITKCRVKSEEVIIEEEKRNTAINEEVRKRYTKYKPEVHTHGVLRKQKWAGLQGSKK